MNQISKGLKSNDATVRNKAAIRIIDTNTECAIPSLVSAIDNPDNIGANGTLVYALGHFDCSQYFELLVRVALQHQFEASIEACSILTEHDFVLHDIQLIVSKQYIEALDVKKLKDFQKNALVEIQERFF